MPRWLSQCQPEMHTDLWTIPNTPPTWRSEVRSSQHHLKLTSAISPHSELITFQKSQANVLETQKILPENEHSKWKTGDCDSDTNT